MPNWYAPWRKAGPTTGIDDVFVEDQNGNVVARMGRDMTPEDRAAKLALIVAAPELYAALDAIVNEPNKFNFANPKHPIWTTGPAALAKARGEAA